MTGAAEPTTSPAEIAIIGGGPSGLSLAGILERAGMSYVIYEKYARDEIPLGGCLDMHKGSGHAAMEQAGCYAEFRKYGRLGPATIHQVWAHSGHEVFAWGEGKDAPELDRFQIKKALLTTVPDARIRWHTGLLKAERDSQGKIVLHLSDGTTATGFKLVVGADGTWSKVRSLITPAKPKFSGVFYITGLITDRNPFYPEVVQMAREGPMIVMGRKTNIWNQRQGDGHYRCDLGFLRPENFAAAGGTIDLTNTESVKDLMLTDEYFGQHAPQIRSMIRSLEGPFRAWPLYFMPPEELNWRASSDVTLIGDAAHTTLPFVGEGANCAMRDAVTLAKNLKETGIGQEAIAAYEKDMLPYAADVIERSNASGDLFFDYNSPLAFAEGMKKRPLIANMI